MGRFRRLGAPAATAGADLELVVLLVMVIVLILKDDKDDDMLYSVLTLSEYAFGSEVLRDSE